MKTYNEIKRVNDIISKELSRLEMLEIKIPNTNRYRYEFECRDMAKVILKNINAIILLSKSDIFYVNSAKILCRSVFEGSIKIKWLLKPETALKRDARWISMVKAAKRELITLQNESIGFDSSLDPYSQEIIELENTIIRVSTALELADKNINIKEGIPSFNQLLEDGELKFMYSLYRELSKNVHHSHNSNTIFSPERGLNDGGILREWWAIYFMIFMSLILGIREYFSEYFSEEDVLFTEEYSEPIKNEIDEILLLAKSLVNWDSRPK